MTKIWSIEGNRQLLDGGAMFGNVPRLVWEKWIAPDIMGRIPLACRCLLIEVDGLHILCETGIGAFFDPKMAARFGVQSPDRHLLRENLVQIGIPPEKIDYVILSHLHFDHAGGLLPTHQEMQQGHKDLIFPNARFVVGKEAWERALQPHARDRASFIPQLTDLLKQSGRLLMYPQDPLPAALSGRIQFLTTSGHTPGQLHTLFRGDRETAFFCGDLIPGRPWVHLPITMGYDRYPEQLIDEKAAIYQRATAENWLLFFTHDPAISGSHVVRSGNDKYEPTDLHETFVGYRV